jgi:hypothetical protein
MPGPSPFLVENPERYWPSEDLTNPSPVVQGSVADKEWRSIILLLDLIERYTPHLRGSFVCSEDWWKQHLGTPEAHVSCVNPPATLRD